MVIIIITPSLCRQASQIFGALMRKALALVQGCACDSEGGCPCCIQVSEGLADQQSEELQQNPFIWVLGYSRKDFFVPAVATKLFYLLTQNPSIFEVQLTSCMWSFAADVPL